MAGKKKTLPAPPPALIVVGENKEGKQRVLSSIGMLIENCELARDAALKTKAIRVEGVLEWNKEARREEVEKNFKAYDLEARDWGLRAEAWKSALEILKERWSS